MANGQNTLYNVTFYVGTGNMSIASDTKKCVTGTFQYQSQMSS